MENVDLSYSLKEASTAIERRGFSCEADVNRTMAHEHTYTSSSNGEKRNMWRWPYDHYQA